MEHATQRPGAGFPNDCRSRGGGVTRGVLHARGAAIYASVRDTRLYFDIEGAGLVPEPGGMRERHAAMVIHGGPGADHSGFKPSMSPLTDTVQLVYFDHRGQGRSARGDPARYTLDENVADMEALRQHLGLGPIVSIGTSYGGMVGMAHAARHPHAVALLVLVVTASHGGFIEQAQARIEAEGTPEQREVCATLWQGAFQTPEEVRHYYDVMGPLYARRFDPAEARAVRDRSEPSPEPLNRAFAPDGFLRNFDLRPELGSIRAPTLIIAGKRDWICPPEFSQEIHRLIPGSQLEVFEHSSHSIRVDEPERLLQRIRACLAGLTQE